MTAQPKVKHVSLGATIIAAFVTLVLGVFVGANWSNFAPYLGFKTTSSVQSTLDWFSLDEVYAKLVANYNGDIDPQAAIEGAKKGLVNSLGDRYTSYMDAEEAAAFEDSLHGNVGGGIGIEFGSRNGYPTILRTLPDNPARAAGILAGDIIYKVDDEEVWNKSVEIVASKTRGEVGSTVKLTIIRDGKELDFTLTREEINNVSAYLTYRRSGTVAVITITRFDTDTAALVTNFAKEIVEKNCEKVILDLRNNGGGYVAAAIDILSLWLNGDKILTQKSKNFPDEVTYANRNKAILADMKTIILINQNTASSSEIVAGALRDYDKATLVGEKSFGKGVVQTLLNLSGGSTLKVTTAAWYTPLDVSINSNGITPDIEVINTDDDINALRDPQLDKALSL